MSWLRRGSIGRRIAVAALAIALISIGIITIGVQVGGGSLFMALMTSHGETAASAQEMFESTVLSVLLVAVLVAIGLAVVLAILAGRWVSRPLRALSAAARQVAAGTYDARISPSGTDELAGLIEAFNQMSASLEEQERMRREFVANAAHELRTPLTNLKGYLEGLRDGVVAADRATFESLWEETERLVRLSESLDDLDREASHEAAPVDVDLSRAIESAVALSRAASASMALRWTVDCGPDVRVRVDPDHLVQILANLLQNAVRYTPRGGAVSVRAAERDGQVVIGVTNGGASIPTAALPHIFERFYRVDASRDRRSGGAGIGLAIVKQLVEAAGGVVGAESADGRVTIWFSLPRSTAATEAGT